MTEEEIRTHLLEEFESYTGGGVYLIVTKPEDYHSTTFVLIEHMIKNLNLIGVYVTLNTPCSSLSANLKDKGIDTSKLYFVDAISKQSGTTTTSDNCSFVQNPQSLTELSLVTTKAVNTGKSKFLFFDSVSTLLIYNSLETTEKFMHYLINKIRSLGLLGIIISLDEEKSNKLIPVISQFCDKIIHLGQAASSGVVKG